MTLTIGILLLFVVCYAIVQIILGVRALNKKNYYQHLYKAETTKAYFANTRNEMMKMCIEKELDPSTDMFKQIYHLNTVIMRCPDEYPKISLELFRVTALNVKATKPAKELTLTESEKKIIKMTADSLGHIIIEYNWLLRYLFNSFKGKNRNVSSWGFVMLLFGKENVNHEKEKVKVEQQIKETKKKLYDLSGYGFNNNQGLAHS
jgi:hypothetical protein